MTEEERSRESARVLINTVDEVSARSSRSLAISVMFYVGIGLIAAIVAAIAIIQSFDGRGVAIAIAVVGGAVGVFILTLGARLVGDAVVKAMKAAQEARETTARR
jgi:predicted exporter